MKSGSYRDTFILLASYDEGMSDSKETESALLVLRASLQAQSDKEEFDVIRRRLTLLSKNLNSLADKELSSTRENLIELKEN